MFRYILHFIRTAWFRCFKSVEELEEVQERIDQTEIGNPLLKQILTRSYQSRLNSLGASA